MNALERARAYLKKGPPFWFHSEPRDSKYLGKKDGGAGGDFDFRTRKMWYAKTTTLFVAMWNTGKVQLEERAVSGAMVLKVLNDQAEAAKQREEEAAKKKQGPSQSQVEDQTRKDLSIPDDSPEDLAELAKHGITPAMSTDSARWQSFGPRSGISDARRMLRAMRLKICTAATPEGAYGLCKAMIRDDGPGMLFTPVKLMKDEKVPVDVGTCLPLNKAHLMSKASDQSVSSSKAVTVLTYLHGVREAVNSIQEIQAAGHDIDLIELRSLKPLDLDTIRESLARTHKLVILDESTQSGGVGASISALVGEELFDELDAPVKRLCMDDAPVPYASSMEQSVVKRGSDLVIAVKELVDYV